MGPTGPKFVDIERGENKMFVRWKTRATSGADDRLTAEILESRRINGRPRQKSVLYLGGINRRRIASKDLSERFWRRVDVKLAGLPLSPGERQKIEVAILRVVPRDKRERRKQAEARLSWYIDLETELIKRRLIKLHERLEELDRERVRLSDLLSSGERRVSPLRTQPEA